MLMRKVQFAGLLAVLAALALIGSGQAADPDKKLIAKAQKFLEDTNRAKSVLGFANFGATYQGVKTRSWSTVVDEKNRELDGYFTLTVRYSWAGLLSSNEYTDLVFFFNDKGRLYHINSGATSGLLKPFELSKLIIDVTKEAVRAAVKDSSDAKMKESVEAAIKNVDAKALLRLKLILEQP
jgi:hypothetical protein